MPTVDGVVLDDDVSRTEENLSIVQLQTHRSFEDDVKVQGRCDVNSRPIHVGEWSEVVEDELVELSAIAWR